MNGFPKSDLDLILKARSGFCVRRRFHRRSAAEELCEQIAEAWSCTPSAPSEIESAEIETYVAPGHSFGHAACAGGFEPELIVHLAFLGIGDDVISFLHLLALLVRASIAWIQGRTRYAL